VRPVNVIVTFRRIVLSSYAEAAEGTNSVVWSGPVCLSKGTARHGTSNRLVIHRII